MTEYKKVFLDTTPLIYFLDDDIHFGLKTRQIFEEILYNDRLLLTSVLTCMEYLVHPYRTNNQAKIKACADFLNDCHIPVLSINLEIANKSSANSRCLQGLQIIGCITTGNRLCIWMRRFSHKRQAAPTIP